MRAQKCASAGRSNPKSQHYRTSHRASRQTIVLHSSRQHKSSSTKKGPGFSSRKQTDTNERYSTSLLKANTMINKRQLYPIHVYGESQPSPLPYEVSHSPAQPIVTDQYKPTHIQYISGMLVFKLRHNPMNWVSFVISLIFILLFAVITTSCNFSVLLSFSSLSLFNKLYNIYLGYQFLPIPDFASVKKDLQTVLKRHDVLGRIYLETDGINLQMCCHPSRTQDVISSVRQIHNNLFQNTRIFANDIVDTATIPPLFDKLTIIKHPILNDGLDSQYSQYLTKYIESFNHLSPEQWHQEMKQADAVNDPSEKPIILDIRNLYEYEVGAFKGAIAVDVDAYRDTFAILDELLGIPHDSTQHASLPTSNTSSAATSTTPQSNWTQNLGLSQKSLDHLSTLAVDPNVSSEEFIRAFTTARQAFIQDNGTDETTLGSIQRSQLQRQSLPIARDQTLSEQQHQQQTLLVGKVLSLLQARQTLRQQQEQQQQQSSQSNTSSESLSAEQLHHLDKPLGKLELHGVDKSKKILAYCTGGIRCLKVGAYLVDHGFSNVNVLNGGVNAYAVYASKHFQSSSSQENSNNNSNSHVHHNNDHNSVENTMILNEPNYFQGSNVVFDQRRAVKIGQQILSHCHQCHELTDIQRNCANAACDILHIQCKPCEDTYFGTCSIQCSEDSFGTGDITRQRIRERQILGENIIPVIVPPQKQRIRPRIIPYSITQYADHLDMLNNHQHMHQHDDHDACTHQHHADTQPK